MARADQRFSIVFPTGEKRSQTLFDDFSSLNAHLKSDEGESIPRFSSLQLTPSPPGKAQAGDLCGIRMWMLGRQLTTVETMFRAQKAQLTSHLVYALRHCRPPPEGRKGYKRKLHVGCFHTTPPNQIPAPTGCERLGFSPSVPGINENP